MSAGDAVIAARRSFHGDVSPLGWIQAPTLYRPDFRRGLGFSFVRMSEVFCGGFSIIRRRIVSNCPLSAFIWSL